MGEQKHRSNFVCDVCSKSEESWEMPKRWEILTLAKKEGERLKHAYLGDYLVCTHCQGEGYYNREERNLKKLSLFRFIWQKWVDLLGRSKKQVSEKTSERRVQY